ncbi:MAG: recombination protein O N-terminal domain-containing protein [Patescibacteria group bacterium]
MPYLRDTVIVLKKEPYREHDRRYTLYGREHGLLVGVARGSSLPASKQAGHLEPFMEAQVMIAKGAAFDKLAVAAGSRFPFDVMQQNRLAFFAVCGAFTGLVVALLRPGIADERIFYTLQELITVMATTPEEPSAQRARLLLSAATLRLLDVLGFAPPIERPAEGTSSVPSLALVSFMRRSPLADVLRVTATTDVLAAASGFVEAALEETPLIRAPHGPLTVQALLARTF